jgi:hypothetical protein
VAISVINTRVKSACRVAVAAAFGLSLVGLSGAGASAAGAAPVQPQVVTYYSLINYNSAKCLDVPESSTDDGQGLEQYSCNGGGNQKWALESTDSGYFRIVNSHSGKCADVRERSSDNNAVVNQYSCNTQYNQQWLLRAAPAGVSGYQLVARHSDKCMTVANSSLADKAGIIQYTCGAAAAWNQYWQLA